GVLPAQWVTQNNSNIEINLNEKRLAPCVQVTANTIPPGASIISVALTPTSTQPDDPFLQPTDVKKTGMQAIAMKCIQGDVKPLTLLNVAVKYRVENKKLIVEKGVTGVLARRIPRANQVRAIVVDPFLPVPRVETTNGGLKVQTSLSEMEDGKQAQPV